MTAQVLSSAPSRRSSRLRSASPAHLAPRGHSAVRWYVAAAAVGVAVGLATLPLLPSIPAYDAWSWLVWGRQLAHGTLVTAGAGSSIKPLPILVDAGLWLLFGHAAPTAWVVVARAGAVVAVALAYRLGRELAGRGAGLLAAAALATSYQLGDYLFMRGMSEPLEVALALAAVDAHLHRRRWLTLALLTLGALARIELSAFVVVYGLWCLWRLDRRLLTVAATIGSLLVVVAGWFGMELWGSGDLMRSASRATMESQGGPLLYANPGLATLREAIDDVFLPVTVGFVLEVVRSVVVLVRRRVVRPTLWLAAGAVVWVAGEALMAQLRVATGAPRYLLPGLGAAAVVSGVGWLGLGQALWKGRAHPALRLSLAVVALFVLVVGTATAGPFGWTPARHNPAVLDTRQISSDWHQDLRVGRISSDLDRTAPDAVRLAGGRGAVLRCGPIVTQPLQIPALAWALDIRPGRIDYRPRPDGTNFQAGNWFGLPRAMRRAFHQVGATSGRPGEQWRVLSSCPPAS